MWEIELYSRGHQKKGEKTCQAEKVTLKRKEENNGLVEGQLDKKFVARWQRAALL